MFRRKKQNTLQDADNFHESHPASEFYTARPPEKLLHEEHSTLGNTKTKKHTKETRKERGDLRDKADLLGLLQLASIALSLLVVFFSLKTGIGFYEESQIAADLAKSSLMQDQTPVMQAVELIKSFDIQNQESRQLFAERVESWKEADRLIRSADALLLHNIYDQAIAQCLDALKIDPSHRGALERLGKLYYAKKEYAAAINVYIHLMSVDPSHKEIQKNLIQALDAYGDDKAVVYMTGWYFDRNTYDPDIQRYLANALFNQKKFDEAIAAFSRVLRDSPEDTHAMERLATAYMQTEQYEKALDMLETLRKKNYRNPVYYKQIVVCNAQLERGKETVDALQRAAQLFGEQMALSLIQDPRLDPVRENVAFQRIADRIGGEEFRLWLEKMASEIQTRKQDDQENPNLQLNIPNIKRDDSELLKMKK
jgi:tetratricopeptide (TPR) repeat protein